LRRSLKAALLSALVFPGCGHLIFKKYIAAALLGGISIVCIYLMLTSSIQMAEDIVAKVQSGEIPLDANQIEAAVTNAEQAANGVWWADLTSYLLGVCWVVGIVDSYRLGRRHERSQRNV